MSVEERLKRLESLVQNMVRVGKVSVQDDARARVRVTFPDRENVQSDWLQVMVHNTQKNKDYWMPEVGEDVLCVFLPVGLSAGFVMGGFYVEGVGLPASTADVRVVQFADGGRVEYDRASSTATVVAPTRVVIDAPDTEVTGNLLVKGTGTVQGLLTYQAGLSGAAGGGSNNISGDLVVDGISVPRHKHTEQGDGAPTSAAHM